MPRIGSTTGLVVVEKDDSRHFRWYFATTDNGVGVRLHRLRLTMYYLA